MTLHFKAEGSIEYTGLLFVPSKAPYDLFQPDRLGGIKLYVNKVFISDKVEGLMPMYLRFVRGVIDSADLPLNISREMLQQSALIAKIRQGTVSRLFKELKNARRTRRIMQSSGTHSVLRLRKEFMRTLQTAKKWPDCRVFIRPRAKTN